MIARNLIIFHTALLQTFGQAALASDLDLAADSPTVSVETRASGRNFIRLPALRYTVRVGTECADRGKPARLSLNVADTRVVLDEGRIVSGAVFDVPLLIPSSQIAPIAVEGFCLAESAGPVDGKESLTVPSVLSIQGSLLCSGENGEKIVYASTALNVTLECARSNAEAAGSDASVTLRQVPVQKLHSP